MRVVWLACQGNFDALTLSSVVKWESIEPEPNSFNFGPFDEIVRFAESVNAKVRGHNFEWYDGFPHLMIYNLHLLPGATSYLHG